jgi:hypothetical protein
MMPVITTTGEFPFEVGIRPRPQQQSAQQQQFPHDPAVTSAVVDSGGSETTSGVKRLLPVFVLPAVPPAARYVRRIPREDTAEEAAARRAEAEELENMKAILSSS